MQAPDPNEPGTVPAAGRVVRTIRLPRRVARRRIRRRWHGGILFVLVMFAVNGVAPTAHGAEKTPATNRFNAQPLMTPESAADVARRETGGRVLSVTPLEGGHRGFRVRLLLDGGRVTTVLVGPGGGVRPQR